MPVSVSLHPLLVALTLTCSDAVAAPFAVPHVDLVSIDARTTKTALKTTGAVAVRVPGLAQARAAAFAGLADCLEGDGQEALLVDGTRRRTIAARGAGFDSVCFDDEASKALRRAAFDAVQAVAGALDDGGGKTLRGDSAEYDWRGVVDKGRHLEHVHAYYGPSKGEALEAHVDEGVMVAMVAGEGGVLQITLPGGASHELRWDAEHAVLILAGDASRYLGNARPAPHSLSLALSDNEARPWYGLMILPPDDALLDGERFDKRREKIFALLRQSAPSYMT